MDFFRDMFLILDQTSTKWEGDQSSSCNTLLKVFWQVCRNAFVSFKNSCLTLSFSSIIVDLQCTCLMYIISVTIFLVYNYKKACRDFKMLRFIIQIQKKIYILFRTRRLYHRHLNFHLLSSTKPKITNSYPI